MYTFHDVLVPYVHVPGPMSLDHMYTYQGLCPGNKHILTRAYVLISYVYLPGPMSLDHMYTYQDLCPWIICILTRTYVLGSYAYLLGLMPLDHMYTYQDLRPTSLDHMYTYQDLCPWIICIYLPGPMSLDHMYIYQDLCTWVLCTLTRTYGPWKNNIHTSTRQSHTQTKNNEEKYAQTGRNCGKKMLDTEIGELQIV